MCKIRVTYLIFVVLVLPGCATKNEKTAEPQIQEELAISNDQEYQENDAMELAGILVCAHCFALSEENVGLDHHLPESGFVKDCASRCADLGYPIGVLLDPPKAGTNLWVIRTSAQLFTDYMSDSVVVKGAYVVEGVIEPTSITAPEPGRIQIIL